MSWITSLFVEPVYRLVYGRPARRSIDGSGERRDRGLVLTVGGVGGANLSGTGLRYVVAAERLPWAVDHFLWSHGVGRWYADLTDVTNRDLQAASLAEAIRRFRATHPGEPVFVVGKSGGAGIAVKALERLDPDNVERAILLAPAVSPRYDLAPALRAVRRELVVFWSPLDMIVLGAGTRMFGTIDRVRTVGAGLVGFSVPGPGEPDDQRKRQYAKLCQVRWRPRMARFGHLGGHFGSDHPRFLRECVVPLLSADDRGPDSRGGEERGAVGGGRALNPRSGSSCHPAPPIS
jgi:pimeloyl-ACP methyl ester carboxylesterase